MNSSETDKSGTRKPSTQITIMGVAIGAVWLTMGVLSMVTTRQGAKFDDYALGASGQPLWVQLISYAFIQWWPLFLFVQLVWLGGIVRISRDCLSPAGFIRLFSLGTLGMGLVFLFVVARDSEGSMTGGSLVLMTMHGALVALRPRDRLIQPYSTFRALGRQWSVSKVLWGCGIIACLLDGRFLLGGIEVDRFLVIIVASWYLQAALIIAAMIRTKLLAFIVVYIALYAARIVLLPAVLEWDLNSAQVKRLMNPYLYAILVAFALGAVYGFCERRLSSVRT